jgi:transcriptional regulator with PAS, ATPase and Fis domain
MKKTIEMAKNYSKTDATILIQGESGTGKEIFAQSIHTNSTRSEGPFVAVNCAALPPQLLESELFGYVEGSFTGASKGGKMGLFEMAHNGTIFLDEIGDMDRVLQARLLRVLEEKQVMRIGSDKIVPINIRVIAATNVNLKGQVTNGSFRSDLYYRLNVLNLNLTPLRGRIIDIKYLANHFIKMSNKKYGTQVEKLSQEVMELLSSYSWPGNIREMKNIIERIVLTAKKDYITLNDIELIIDELNDNEELSREDDMQEEFFDGTLREIKKKIIKKILKEEGDNKSKTAKRLGIDRSTLDRIL